MARSIDLDVTEELDITSKRGDSFSMTLTLKNAAGTALTLATDNYEFFFRVKRVTGTGPSRRGSIILGTPNVAASANKFESPTTDDSGNVVFAASSEVTRKIPSGTYSYEIQYRLPSSTALDSYVSILMGAFTVNADITENAV